MSVIIESHVKKSDFKTKVRTVLDLKNPLLCFLLVKTACGNVFTSVLLIWIRAQSCRSFGCGCWLDGPMDGPKRDLSFTLSCPITLFGTLLNLIKRLSHLSLHFNLRNPHGRHPSQHPSSYVHVYDFSTFLPHFVL